MFPLSYIVPVLSRNVSSGCSVDSGLSPVSTVLSCMKRDFLSFVRSAGLSGKDSSTRYSMVSPFSSGTCSWHMSSASTSSGQSSRILHQNIWRDLPPCSSSRGYSTSFLPSSASRSARSSARTADSNRYCWMRIRLSFRTISKEVKPSIPNSS